MMIKTINKLLSLLTPMEQRKALGLLVMIIFMAILDVAGVASIMPFMAAIANPNVIKTNSTLAFFYYALEFKDSHSFMLFLGVVVIIFLVMSLAFKAYATYVQLRFGLMREYSIGRRLIEGYLHQPYIWFLNKHSANLGNVILSEVNQVIGSAMTPMMTMIAQGLLSISMLGLLVAMDPLLALIIGSALGITYAIIYYVMRGFLYRIGSERVQANQARYKIVNEAFTGVKEIKVGGFEDTYVGLFSIPAESYAKNHASIQVLVQIPRFAVEAVAFGGMLLVVLYLVSGKGGFESGLPLIAVYSFAGYRLMPALQMVYASIVQLRSADAALEVLNQDLNSLPPYEFEVMNESVLRFINNIKLDNICFAYPFANKNSLEGVSLNIPVRTTIGLVGSSGSGKTTTADLILGLLVAKTGTFSVDGIEINASNRRSWQRGIGYVPQQIFLTDDSIAANIAFGIPNEKINMKAVERAAQMANLHDFVSNELAEGYYTTVGERGVRLSGGQRQRIGIARALYHNPQLLILDEATSALDNLTELAVMEAVKKLGGNITIIIIAHRLSTVRACDQIYLMQKGEVIAHGKYDELIKYNEQFRIMANQ